MPITDLTGCVWVSTTSVPDRFEFSKTSPAVINFTYNNTNYSGMYENSDDWIFYKSNVNDYNWETDSPVDWDIWKWDVTPPITLTFTGGTDATNSTLIAWLEANGTLTAPQPTLIPPSIGNKDIVGAFVGNKQVKSMWLGNTKIYEGGAIEYTQDGDILTITNAPYSLNGDVLTIGE